MWFVGVQTCATFCRPPFIQTCWNRRHKWWCRHILGPKIKMRHKTVPNYMPARGQDIELSRNTFSKKDWHMDIVLLHLELRLNFSRHIRHGRVLTNIGLWSRIHEIQIGVSRKAGCPWKAWTFQKRINNWNWCSETYHFSNIGHPPGRVTSLCSAAAPRPAHGQSACGRQRGGDLHLSTADTGRLGVLSLTLSRLAKARKRQTIYKCTQRCVISVAPKDTKPDI